MKQILVVILLLFLFSCSNEKEILKYNNYIKSIEEYVEKPLFFEQWKPGYCIKDWKIFDEITDVWYNMWWKWSYLNVVDKETFVYFKKSWKFAIDKNNVYFSTQIIKKFSEPTSFFVLSYPLDNLIKYNNKLYLYDAFKGIDNIKIINSNGFDVETFKIVWSIESYFSHKFYFAKDKNKIFLIKKNILDDYSRSDFNEKKENGSINGIDWLTVEHENDITYIMPLHNLDNNSFEILSKKSFKDKNGIYNLDDKNIKTNFNMPTIVLRK